MLLPPTGARGISSWVVHSDVMKLVKIRIHQMQISILKICLTRMRMLLFKHLLHQLELCQLNYCDSILFPNINIIGVQISTLSKNFVAHLITVYSLVIVS